MPAPDGIRNLVESFENHIEELKSKDYNEMTLCANFINPFFEFLGWDITNKLDKAEKFKDVVQQYRLTIGGTSKAPDYLFRIGGSPVFFVEAKKPAVDIEKAKEPAFQLRRYGWNKKDIDISILTDFETLSVYDCRIKPSVDDEPHVGRVAKYTYKNFLSHWEEIESFFSRTNVEKGSLDKLLKEKNLKGVRESVDESFLKMIEDWRDILARNIALRNENLDVRQLNFAVQQTIDRIIFLRIAEDRGLETPNQLQALTNAGNIYGGLVKLYENADSRYNSGLFHFRSEKGIDTPPDTITMSLSMDDKVLKDMIVNLYPPKSPYDFSAMPADILGQVYERFLGKVIRLTDGHHAKVEEKPEVRKAGGVYYTPTYIVNYIVQNTVGKLVECKTPEQVAKLRIVDPACGSGSFLIGAYQYLLDWHLDWYLSNDREKWLKGKNPPICEQMREGQRIFRLTTEKRKEILKNNIYGVDIDRQAVEVSKLNLLLKVLEEENNPDLFKHSQRALPDLGSNIKCGNSLIGSDFYNGKENLFNNPEETWRINAFDWDREFPEIVRYKSRSTNTSPSPSGRRCPEGTDEGVLSWPEYNKRQNLLSYASSMRKDSTDAEIILWEMLRDRRFLNLKFRRQHVAGDFILDFYCKEKEFAIELDGGQHTEESNAEYDKRRSDILQNHGIKVVRFWNNDVLNKLESVMEALYVELVDKQLHASTHPSPSGRRCPEGMDEGVLETDDKQPHPSPLLKGEGEKKELEDGFGFDAVIGNPPYIRSEVFDNFTKEYFVDKYSSAYKQYDIYVLFIEKSINVLIDNGYLGFITSNKFLITDYGLAIRNIILEKTEFVNAVDVSYDKVFNAAVYPYIIILKKQQDESIRNSNEILFSKSCLIADNSKKIIQSSFIQKKIFDFTSLGSEWISKLDNNSVALGDIVTISRGFRPPNPDLVNKIDSKEKYIIGKDIETSYRIHWSGNYVEYIKDKIPESKPLELFKKPKIVFRDIGLRFNGYLDTSGLLCLKTIYFIISNEQTNNYNLRYILGLLNSKIINKYFELKFSIAHISGGYLRFRKQFVELIPIRTIDFSNKSDVEMHDRMVSLVNTMLDLNKRLRECGVPSDIEMIKRQIESTDNQIDQLVYRLYGLTDEEIRIVEESFADNKKK